MELPAREGVQLGQIRHVGTNKTPPRRINRDNAAELLSEPVEEGAALRLPRETELLSEIVKRDSREVALRFFEAMLVARLQPFAPHTRHEDGRPIAQFPERNKLAAMLGVTEAEARFENETLTEGIKKLFPLWRPGEIKTVQVRTFRGGEQPISVYEKDVKLVTGEQELKFAKTRLAMMFPESPMALFYGLNETYQNKE